MRHPGTDQRHFSAPLAVVAAIAYLSIFAGKAYWTQFNPILGVAETLKEISVANGLYSRMSRLPPLPRLRVQDHGGEVTHILVIGESLTRNHMSLYGYERTTTPHLSQLSNELFIAKDACSSRNTTIASLKEMLTFATREDPSGFFNGPNLLLIMRAAGFETYWISNQQESGVVDSMASIYAKFADHKVFVDAGGWSNEINSLDGKVIAPLEAVLAGGGAKRKFIVVHLIGSHEDYWRRYPKDYDRFTSASRVVPAAGAPQLSSPALERIAQYDNSVLYNDYIVSRLIAMQNPHAAVTLTYLSDHGEALGERDDFFGHSEDVHYRTINDIPLIFWVSKALRPYMKDKLRTLKSHLDAPFQSDQSIHSLLNFYGVDFAMIRREDSLFDPAFKPKDRYCDHLHY